ncbi:MAG: 16S rRNA (guanine(966)-N(2))-methyltransferase RsmD [Acidobacteriales bacterium]|nr:16S rRNA (guanine(966)-N(2))-methyltransferase RsmD [Terriglobales bacterium]
MRIIAGKYRSRRLRTLAGMDLRPTADRVRESLFNVLTAGNPAALEETVWIDLFAGTGAVGIEALSRGAGFVYFVESGKASAGLIRENLRDLKIDSGFEILEHDSARAIRRLQSFGVLADFIFLDPPYRAAKLYVEALDLLSKSRLLRGDGMVVTEHDKSFDPGEAFSGLRRFRKLVQGSTVLSFYSQD